MKIVFFGTDNFAAKVLAELITHHQVVGVVTVPDAPVGRKQVLEESAVSKLAGSLNIPTFKPASLKKDETIEATLKACDAELFVVAIYSKIIPQNILDIPPRGNVNVHPSLLPLYRGPAPIRTPLLYGDTETGVSIILMDAEVDHGPILAQESILIEPNDTNVSLTEKLATVAAPLLISALADYESGTITPTTQDHTLATYTKIVAKEDGKIDWSKTAQDIYNQWRAYEVWPGIYTTWNGKLLKIINCKSLDVASITQNGSTLSSSRPARHRLRLQAVTGGMRGSSSPTSEQSSVPWDGTVDSRPLRRSFSEASLRGNMNAVIGTVVDGGIVICGQNTYLQITKLQLEGKQMTDIKSFLNGNKTFIGSVLV